MARIPSANLSIGRPLPEFDLPITNPGSDDDRAIPAAFDDKDVLVVIFTCNHCPYAVHVEDELVRLANDYRDRGVAVLAISSNDATRYPADGPDAMAKRAASKGFPFPYAYDAAQEAARAFGAVCTPDPFVFGPDRRLAYHGRVDASRPGMGAANGSELREALDQLLSTGQVDRPQHPAIGCSIKWLPETD